MNNFTLAAVPVECGIYEIRCMINNKSYVGSSNSLRRRMSCHFNDLRAGIHHNKALQADFIEMGEDAFEIFCTIVDLQDIRRREKELLDNLSNCYNAAPVGGLNKEVKARKINKQKSVLIDEDLFIVLFNDAKKDMRSTSNHLNRILRKFLANARFEQPE